MPQARLARYGLILQERCKGNSNMGILWVAKYGAMHAICLRKMATELKVFLNFKLGFCG